MRPRIRTIKPEVWADEKVGDLSHSARLLFVGLITMADDEGRLRELPSAILGHVFPHDNITPAKLRKWLGEIDSSRMVVRYVVGGKNYLAFRRWSKHQKIDRANGSELPPPPDDFDDGSSNDRRSSSDSFDDHSRSPRTRASGPIRSPSDPGPSSQRRVDARARSKRADQDALPLSLPGELHHAAHLALTILQGVQSERGGNEPTIRGVGLAVQRFPNRDHAGVARQLEHWALAGTGQAKPVADWARTFATFLERSPAGKPVKVGDVVALPPRSPVLDRADAWMDGYEEDASA